jgi:flagellar hook-associated protein 3 FlgL
MHEQIISAGNGTYSDSDKAAVSASLQGYYDQLLTLANSTDSAGNYLFSGKKSDTAPFVINSHQVTAGQLGEYKASSFTIPSGNTTWLDVNGSVLAAGSVPESESGKIFYSASTSTPPTFADAPTGAAKVTISSVTYQGDSEQSQIQVNNSRKMSASVVGSDLFAGGDIFNKLQAAITALNTPTNGSASKASTQASVLSDLNSSFNATFAAVSTAQSSVGTRLKSLDDLKTASGNLDLQLAQTLSGLQDVDYNKAVSDLTRQQFILQAAQQTFAKIGKSSLFDYMA